MFLDKEKQQQRRVWPWVVAVVLFLLIGLVAFLFFIWRGLTPEQLIDSGIVKKYVGEEHGDILALVPRLLGFTEPQTYLVLFQNNTEMRPSGGFIGAYATIHLDKGQIQVLDIEGSEELDRRTPPDWKPVPPRPVSEYLGVPQWYFRDANWSPDFGESAKKVREFYAAETGVAAGDIDGVIAITPTVLERVLKLTGPITVQNLTFTSENVTETLEYEVEYGYRERGIPFETRKQILAPFFHTVLQELKKDAIFDFPKYLAEVKRLTEEKQIMFAFDNPEVQKFIDDRGWSGRVIPSDSDYLLWVDANMAALKTDHALKRSLSYTIQQSTEGDLLATASMTYTNNGTFDWRTSRYRSYARIFVPEGSELISVEGSMLKDKSSEPGTLDQGNELGKTWFGTFISLEPKQTKTLSFTYRLPEYVNTKIIQKKYDLLVQKQPGTIDTGLTLDLKFATSIAGANPAEDRDQWGDSVYAVDTDLRVDRRFDVKF